jgi:hypothetical protein
VKVLSRLGRALGWLGLVVVLVLSARAVVYGMAPTATQMSRELGGRLGGPGFAATLVIAVSISGALTAIVLWLASLGVRERWELAEHRPDGPRPGIALGRLALRALTLTLVGWLAFAGVESAVHLHEGLGFHGLDCLVGPVHRNALPVVCALALLASGLLGAAELVLAWRRRTVSRLETPRPRTRQSFTLTNFTFLGTDRRPPLFVSAPSRGPPLPVL